MKTYARIANGLVAEVIPPATLDDGTEIPIAERFTQDFVSTLVDASALIPTDGQVATQATDGTWTFSNPSPVELQP